MFKRYEQLGYVRVVTIHSFTDIQVLPVPIQPKTFRFRQRSFDFKKHEQRTEKGLAVVVRQ